MPKSIEKFVDLSYQLENQSIVGGNDNNKVV